MKNNLRVEIFKIKDSEELFKKFDFSNDSELQINEFASLIKYMGVSMDREEIEFVFNKFDTDKSGSIAFNEFRLFVEDTKETNYKCIM